MSFVDSKCGDRGNLILIEISDLTLGETKHYYPELAKERW